MKVKTKAELIKDIKQFREGINCKEMRKLVKTKKPSTLTVTEGLLIAEHAMGCRKCRSLKLQDKV